MCLAVASREHPISSDARHAVPKIGANDRINYIGLIGINSAEFHEGLWESLYLSD